MKFCGWLLLSVLLALGALGFSALAAKSAAAPVSAASVPLEHSERTSPWLRTIAQPLLTLNGADPGSVLRSAVRRRAIGDFNWARLLGTDAVQPELGSLFAALPLLGVDHHRRFSQALLQQTVLNQLPIRAGPAV